MPFKDIIVSSRVRLARNVEGLPFPTSDIGGIASYKRVLEGATAAAGFEYTLANMGELPDIDKEALVERHLISKLLCEKGSAGAVLLSKDRSISVMINEEDHIRAQCIKPGNELYSCYRSIVKYDKELAKHLNIAFDSQFGYLTSCLTNLGTGMRASVMLFLPALVFCNKTGALINLLKKNGVTVRGIYGEGSRYKGDMFQISNTYTLGVSEEEILSVVDKAVEYCMQEESIARKRLKEERGLLLEDEVYRAYGVLTNARLLDSDEFMSQISKLKLGMSLGIINFTQTEKLDEIVLSCQPGNLCCRVGRRLSDGERDLVRAETVREALVNLK